MADPIGQPNIDPTGQNKRSPADYIDTGKIAQALNVNMEGVPGAPDISKIKERVTTPQAAVSELGTLAEQEQKLRQTIGQLETGQGQALKIGEAGVAQYASDTANQIREGQERIKSENPYPKFIPTQENVQSLSTLFSLLGVIAVGGGSKNKLSAMGAINSMTGMLKGWREGRADLWKREQAQFEKDMAQVKANLDSAARDADLALKMLPYDVRKAETMMQELVAKTGSQILTQKANLQGVQEAVKYIKELQSGFKEQFEQNLKTRAATLADTREAREAENQRKLQENAAERLKLEKQRVEFERERVNLEKQKLGAGGAKDRSGSVERMTNAMTQAAGAIRSVASLPVETTGPLFAQKNFDGLFVAPLSALNQEMSDTTSQMLAGRMVGVARNLATLETGGAATGLVGLAQKIEDGTSIPTNAKLYVALDRLAEMRRIVEDSARSALSSSKYTPDQKNLIRENVEIVERAIPFTLDDVAKAVRASKGKSPEIKKGAENMTFTDYVNQYGVQSAPSTDSGWSIKEKK